MQRARIRQSDDHAACTARDESNAVDGVVDSMDVEHRRPHDEVEGVCAGAIGAVCDASMASTDSAIVVDAAVDATVGGHAQPQHGSEEERTRADEHESEEERARAGERESEEERARADAHSTEEKPVRPDVHDSEEERARADGGVATAVSSSSNSGSKCAADAIYVDRASPHQDTDDERQQPVVSAVAMDEATPLSP